MGGKDEVSINFSACETWDLFRAEPIFSRTIEAFIQFCTRGGNCCPNVCPVIRQSIVNIIFFIIPPLVFQPNRSNSHDDYLLVAPSKARPNCRLSKGFFAKFDTREIGAVVAIFPAFIIATVQSFYFSQKTKCRRTTRFERFKFS